MNFILRVLIVFKIFEFSHEEEEQEWVGEEIGPTINNFCKIVSVSSAFQKVRNMANMA